MPRSLSLNTLFLLLCLLISAGSFAQSPTLEQRLQVLEDKEAIRSLLLSYGRFVDARDWPALAQLFAKNAGTWDGGMGVAQGRPAIIEMMQTTMPSTNLGTSGKGVSNLHLLSNEFIDVNGDTATALSKWAFIMTGADQSPTVTFIGHYEDLLVREGSEWKFARRTVSSDIAGTMPLPDISGQPQ